MANPKGDKRDRTRATLLEAARSLIREKGYEHATLDAIAERAGMTTGAIYGELPGTAMSCCLSFGADLTGFPPILLERCGLRG